jgi:hypothetical protein
MMPNENSNVSEPVTLSFSLTRMQRIFNPFERIVYSALLLIGILPIALWIIILYWGLWQAQLLTSIVVAISVTVFWNPLISLYSSVVSPDFPWTVVIYRGVVYVSIDSQVMSMGSGCYATTGLFSTTVIRQPASSRSVILPQHAITLSELKELL